MSEGNRRCPRSAQQAINMVGDEGARAAAQSLAAMSAPPDEAFRGYANFRTYARGGPRGAPRAGGRCSSWRSHIAVILAACGAIFASYLDGWSLHALRALDLQPTPSGRSGLVNAASNGPDNAHDFHGSVVNISGKNYSSYNGAAFNRSTENVFQYIRRSFEDIALDGLTLNSSAINGHVFDSRTFDKLALNDSSNNIPVEDSVFNDPSFSDSAFNVPALYEELSNGTDSISSPLNKKGLNRHTYAEWALNYPVKNGTALNGRAENGSALDDRAKNGSALDDPAKNGSALDDRAKNGSALNGTVLDNRTYNHFALNDGAYNSSAVNYHVGKDFSLNAPLLSERDNGSVMYIILHDNGPALYDISENGSVSNYRDENDLPLNNLSNNDSALNDHYLNDRGVKCATLNRPSLDDCGDNGSVLSSPSLDDHGDKRSDVNDLYLIDREDNGSTESSPSVKDYGDNRPASSTRGDNGHVFNGPAGPALHSHTGNHPFFNVGGATGTSKGSTTHAGALDGFWSFHPTLLHAMMPVGSALAAWAFGRGADRLGRRFALLACGLVGALAWLLLLCERSSVQWVCASRILVGVQMGAIFTVFPVYVAEIAHVYVVSRTFTMIVVLVCLLTSNTWLQPHSRGLASSMLCVAVALGRLLWTACGHQGLWWAGLVPLPVLAVQWLLRRYMPETPDFLEHVGRPGEAVDMRRQLHGAQSASAPETWRMERLMSPEPEDEGEGEAGGARGANAAKGRAAPRATDYVELVRLKRRLQAAARRRQQQSRRRAIAVSAGLFVLAPLAATDVLRFYVEEYISNLGESKFSMAVVIGILELIALLLSAGFVDCMGRRALFFISTLGLAIIHSGLSVIAGHDRSSSQWLLILLSGLFFAHDIGLGSVPWVVLGDMLPANGRAHLSGVIVLLNTSVITGLIYLFPIFHSNVGDKWTFISLVLMSLTINIYVGHMIKETKKRTLEQIQKDMETVEVSSGSSDSEKEWP